MSVIAYYARLTSEALEQLRADPTWEQSLYTRKDPGTELIDIDESCDGLVWLLSRVPGPPPSAPEGSGFVMVHSLAGRLQGEDGSKEPKLKSGYGPARSLTIEQVREFSEWLSGVSVEILRSRYDPKRMEQESVYPDI